MSEKKFTVTVKKEVEMRDLADLLVCAFEGGSNYWIEKVTKVEPTSREFIYENSEKDPSKPRYPLYEHPFNPGGQVIVKVSEDYDGDVFPLNLATIEKGLNIMAEKYPKHLGDFLDENYDATTGDIFLQCCVLGDAIFG
jgi:hypothetical protein